MNAAHARTLLSSWPPGSQLLLKLTQASIKPQPHKELEQWLPLQGLLLGRGTKAPSEVLEMFSWPEWHYMGVTLA